jgi:RNA polymerase sigma-70 factor (ECF subfamily)
MVRLHRARRALKERLAAHCGTTSARSCADCGCEERGCCARPSSAP